MSTNWDNPSEMLTRAQAARAQGDTTMAYQFYARASELNPQQVSAWQGRAETAASTDEALVSYAYASALDNNNDVLARTLDAALDQRVQSCTKSDVPLLVALGQEFAQVGMGTRARTLLARASELDPSSTDALVWLAGIAQDSQSQLDYLNRALATNPRDPRARAGLLAVSLPASTVTAAPGAEAASVPLDSLTARPASSQPDAPPSSAEEGATMERLRKLRAQTPADSTSKPTAKKALPPPTDDMTVLRETAASNQTRMRNLMFLLLGVVAVLVILGIILLQLQ